jgi:hypothetical protein
VFSESAEAISSAVSNVDAAVVAEQQIADTFELQQRRAQVYALGGGAGLAAIILAMLAFASPASPEREVAPEEMSGADHAYSTLTDDAMFDTAPPTLPVIGDVSANGPLTSEALNAVAGLCTEFGRVRDAAQLKALLAQAADLLNARGLIVWLGSSAGADLRPVLAHGYSDATLARIPTVARSADNAAAAAYRTGEVQIVGSKPGGSQGAIVAPLLAIDGCIGALTAEIRDRGEESDTTRALSSILAAQLAGVLAAAADAPAAAAEPKTAAG